MKQLTIIIYLAATSLLLSQEATFPPENSGVFNSYISKTQQKISVGDKIELGLPYAGNQFVFINQNNTGIAPNLSGSIVTIVEIEVSGNKKKGYKAYAKFKGYGALPVYINLEPAINSKEIIID